MESQSSRAVRAARGTLCAFAGIALVLTCFAHSAPAQSPSPQSRSTEQNPFSVHQTIFLQHVTDWHGLNDIVTDLRNLFPRTKIFGVQSQMAISLAGTQEDVDAAQKLIAELDRPVKTYRITYTLTDSANGNRGAGQKYVVLAATGQRVDLMQGTKVPVETTLSDKSGSSDRTEIQYVDVGLRIRATPESMGDGLRLESHVEQSSVAGELQTGGTATPKLNETVFDATANLTDGKPQVLGSLDVPGTAKRLEVSVEAEEVK